jgi:hypothetical protein
MIMVGVQTFVQRRSYELLLGLVGVGFLVLLAELIGYRHFEGLQLIGTGATVVGAAAAFLGIRASAGLRRALAGVFLVLALVGLLGMWEHNEDRLGGEERRPPAAQVGQGGQGGQAGQGGQVGPGGQGRQGGPGGFGGFRMPPPPLAPLSLSGFCLLGAVVLLGRRDE